MASSVSVEETIPEDLSRLKLCPEATVNGGNRDFTKLQNDKELIQAALEEAMGEEIVDDLTTPERCETPTDEKGLKPPCDHPSPPKVDWVTITTKFKELVSHLKPGELVQEADFSLFDAMSAIELMDCKMDAALQWRTFREYPRTLEEAIEKGFLKCSNHSPEELVGIMDEVLACIATWLEGHTLAQTVFTCMYLLDIEKVENIYLRAFSLAIVKTVEYMRACICQGRVFAEDDQQGVCHGFNMLTHVSESAIVASLKEAEEKLQNVLKQSSAMEEGGKDSCERLIGGSGIRAWKALHLRMKFVRNLFAFVVAMGKNNSQGIDKGRAKLATSANLMSEMEETIDVGYQLDAENPLTLGFHPVINQHLLPPSYKPYAIIPRPASFSLLRNIILQIQTILGFGKLESFRELFHSIKEFSSGSKSINVLVRSLLVLMCLQGDRKKLFGSNSLEALLRDDSKVFVFPPSLNSKSAMFSTPQAQEVTERFFGRSVATMVEFLRVFCQHRARQRYKIVRCLEILGEYQQETQRIDELLHAISLRFDPHRQHAACFSTWTLYYILQLMTEFMCLGFEFDLYSPFEIHYVYWYLEFLYGWHETTIKSSDRLHATESQLGGGKGKRKTAKKAKSQNMKEKDRECTILQLKRMMCVGVMRALEALIIDEKIPNPSFEHGSQRLCFHNRFVPFMALSTPQMLTFSDYTRLVSVDNYKNRELNLYEAAAKHFQSCKMTLEGLSHRGEELEGMLKVAKTNLVVMNLTAKGHKRDSKKPPLFDFSHHKHFPVIRIN